MAYVAQFRKKLLSVKETEGLTNEEVAKRFGVSKKTWKKTQTAIITKEQ